MTTTPSQLTGRLRLRHLHEITEARGEEMSAEAPRFHRLAREDSAPRAISSFNLFQTPAELADRVAALAKTGRTLEPSAGLGRLYHAIRRRDPVSTIVLVEQSPDCCGELYRATEHDGNARLIQGDFLAQSTATLGQFDSVVMNPPFKMGADVRHILHALTLLTPGSRLVAICGTGPRRQPLFDRASQVIDLPPGSFRSEGTNAGASIVVFDQGR